MNSIYDTLCNTRETLMILPLIFFCFIPLHRDDIKGNILPLLWKILISFLCMEAVMFLVFLFLPADTAGEFNSLLCIIVFFWLYQREIMLARSHLWFVFCTACMIGGSAFLFIHILDIFLRPDATITTITDSRFVFFQIIFECVIILTLFYPARKHLGWLIHHYDDEPVWRIIWVLPLGFVFFSLYFIPYDNSVMRLNRFLHMYITVIIVLLALVAFIYILFYTIAYNVVEKQEIQAMTAALALQAEQYRKLQLHVKETSRLRHDFRHQLIVISEMLQNHKYSELESYLDKYTTVISAMPIQYSDSAAVNAILNHYDVICQDEGIRANFSFCLKEVPSSMEIDFCVLLGNLLENAIESCRKLSEEQRYISLKTGQTAAHIIALQISNPCLESVEKRGETFLSSKRNGEGQGLKSVQMITKRYNGFADISCNNRIFKVKILLNI